MGEKGPPYLLAMQDRCCTTALVSTWKDVFSKYDLPQFSVVPGEPNSLVLPSFYFGGLSKSIGHNFRRNLSTMLEDDNCSLLPSYTRSFATTWIKLNHHLDVSLPVMEGKRQIFNYCKNYTKPYNLLMFTSNMSTIYFNISN